MIIGRDVGFFERTVLEHCITSLPVQQRVGTGDCVIRHHIQLLTVDHYVGDAIVVRNPCKIAVSIQRYRRNDGFLNVKGNAGDLQKTAVLGRINPRGHFQRVKDIIAADADHADRASARQRVHNIIIAD